MSFEAAALAAAFFMQPVSCCLRIHDNTRARPLETNGLGVGFPRRMAYGSLVPAKEFLASGSVRREKRMNMRIPVRHFILSSLILASSLAHAAGDGTPVTSGIAAGRTLSLEQCIDIALQNNPTLLIADERLGMAGKDVSDAWGSFLPDISLNRNWQKSDRTDFDLQTFQPVIVDSILLRDHYTDDLVAWYSQANIPAGVEDQTVHTKYKDWNARASLNLFSGFSKFSSISSARHGQEAARATLGYNRELVVQDVLTAYYNLLRYQNLEQVAVEARDQAAKELERTETYFRLGSAAKSDVLQQKVRLENTRLDLVVATNNVAKAFADLAFVMNMPLAEPFAVDGSLLDTDFAVEAVDDLYDEAMAQRLDLLSSEEELAASRAEVTTAAGNLWPQINLNGSYTRYQNESPYRFGGQESESFSYGYSVSWNIFDRMRTLNGRSRAKANARIAEYQLQQARMNAQVEIRQLHNSLVEARERANVSRETIEQSREELRLAQERFRVGAGTALDVIIAQVNLANSRSQEVQARCDFLIARAKLNRAVGRPVWQAGS